MILNVIILIALSFLNFSFLDRLMLGRRPNWTPFFKNPKKWYKSIVSNETEINTPKYYTGNYSSNIYITTTIYETDKEIEKRKELALKRLNQEKSNDVKYIKELELDREKKEKFDRKWRIKIQTYGFFTIIANLAFCVFLVFYQPIEISQKWIIKETLGKPEKKPNVKIDNKEMLGK